jgi:RHS repeat-associated protein
LSCQTIPGTVDRETYGGTALSNRRCYDPSIGRHVSPDPYLDAPFSPQRLDRYNFGFNNPLRYKRSEALPDVTVELAKGMG